jgi:2-keto-3-deoxy-L-rhamnonate aldolase RhmA
MGFSPQEIGPGTEHEAAMMAVLAAAQKTGKAAGKHCYNAAEVTMRIRQGFQFLALSSDAGLMAQAAREAFNAIDFSGEAEGSAKEAKGSLY